MKRILSILVCIMIVIAFTACTKVSSSPSGTEETVEPVTEEAVEPVTEETVEPVTIMIWCDNEPGVVKIIQDSLNETLADDGITVYIEKRKNVTDQLVLYGNDPVYGPDMFIFAHDKLGYFAEMGILAPITDLVSDDTLGKLLQTEAGVYKGTQYLLPWSFESLVFLYNKALLQESDIPTTTEGMYDYMVANTDTAAGTYAVVNQHVGAYNVAPFIYGFGGYIIDSDKNPGLDNQATKDAVEYNKKFGALQADGTWDTTTTLFYTGKAAALWGGPWCVPAITDAGIDLGVKPLTSFALPNGNGLTPFMGVQSLYVCEYAAESKGAAIGKVLDAMTDVQLGIDLATQCGYATAIVAAYDDADVAANEVVMAIKETAQTGVPMPNIPEMAVMWGPTESLLAAVNMNGEDVNTAAAAAQAAALQAIADMQAQ